jgi:hypothetical protein
MEAHLAVTKLRKLPQCLYFVGFAVDFLRTNPLPFLPVVSKDSFGVSVTAKKATPIPAHRPDVQRTARRPRKLSDSVAPSLVTSKPEYARRGSKAKIKPNQAKSNQIALF